MTYFSVKKHKVKNEVPIYFYHEDFILYVSTCNMKTLIYCSCPNRPN